MTGRRSKRDAQPLSDEFIPAKRRPFMTATPRLFSKAGVRNSQGDVVSIRSMDNEDVFGRVVFRLKQPDAVIK